jgi:uncharacterized protein YegJ (DUF2314 family)
MTKTIQLITFSFLLLNGFIVVNNKTLAQGDEPRFVNADSKDAEYKLTVEKAQRLLPLFEKTLKAMPETSYANVKTYIPDSDGGGAFIWLSDPVFRGDTCIAQIFEIPAAFTNLKVGDRLKFHKKDIKDWYILDKEGRMEGGFSLRYHRSKLSGEKQKEFDEYVGVKEYL